MLSLMKYFTFDMVYLKTYYYLNCSKKLPFSRDITFSLVTTNM